MGRNTLRDVNELIARLQKLTDQLRQAEAATEQQRARRAKYMREYRAANPEKFRRYYARKKTRRAEEDA